MPTTPALSLSHFNLQHWLEVKAARHGQHLDKEVDASSRLTEHPLVDRIVLDGETGKHARVLEVHRVWLDGWYLMAILVNAGNGPRMARVVGNISSTNPQVQRLASCFELSPGYAGPT